jgi:hypothetical protein
MVYIVSWLGVLATVVAVLVASHPARQLLPVTAEVSSLAALERRNPAFNLKDKIKRVYKRLKNSQICESRIALPVIKPF